MAYQVTVNNMSACSAAIFLSNGLLHNQVQTATSNSCKFIFNTKPSCGNTSTVNRYLKVSSLFPRKIFFVPFYSRSVNGRFFRHPTALHSLIVSPTIGTQARKGIVSQSTFSSDTMLQDSNIIEQKDQSLSPSLASETMIPQPSQGIPASDYEQAQERFSQEMSSSVSEIVQQKLSQGYPSSDSVQAENRCGTEWATDSLATIGIPQSNGITLQKDGHSGISDGFLTKVSGTKTPALAATVNTDVMSRDELLVVNEGIQAVVDVGFLDGMRQGFSQNQVSEQISSIDREKVKGINETIAATSVDAVASMNLAESTGSTALIENSVRLSESDDSSCNVPVSNVHNTEQIYVEEPPKPMQPERIAEQVEFSGSQRISEQEDMEELIYDTHGLELKIVVSAAGKRRHAHFLAPLGKRRHLPLLLYLPGLDATGVFLDCQLPKLGDAFDVRCMAIPPLATGSYTELAKRAADLIRYELAARKTDKAFSESAQYPVTVVAESFGAGIGIELASQYADLVQFLVVSNSASGIRRQPALQYGSLLVPFAPSFPFLHELSSFAMAPLLSNWRLLSEENRNLIIPPFSLEVLPQDVVSSRLQMMAQWSPSDECLQRITARTLLLASGADRLLPSVEEAYGLATCIKDCTIRILPFSGHIAFLEKDVSLHELLDEASMVPPSFISDKKDNTSSPECSSAVIYNPPEAQPLPDCLEPDSSSDTLSIRKLPTNDAGEVSTQVADEIGDECSKSPERLLEDLNDSFVRKEDELTDCDSTVAQTLEEKEPETEDRNSLFLIENWSRERAKQAKRKKMGGEKNKLDGFQAVLSGRGDLQWAQWMFPFSVKDKNAALPVEELISIPRQGSETGKNPEAFPCIDTISNASESPSALSQEKLVKEETTLKGNLRNHLADVSIASSSSQKRDQGQKFIAVEVEENFKEENVVNQKMENQTTDSIVTSPGPVKNDSFESVSSCSPDESSEHKEANKPETRNRKQSEGLGGKENATREPPKSSGKSIEEVAIAQKRMLLDLPQYRIWNWLTRPQYYGLENLPGPEEGPMLFVGNHTLFGIYDMPLMLYEVQKQRGITLRGLADPLHWTTGLGEIFAHYGAVKATPWNCYRLLGQGESVLLYPGGGREVAKRKGEKYQLLWKESTDFVRMALRCNATIIPFATIGVEDAFDILMDPEEIMSSPLGDILRPALKATGIEKLELPLATGGGLLPRPERLYFNFGKPLRARDVGGGELVADREKSHKLYLEVKQSVNDGIQFLMEKRKHDPLREILPRSMVNIFEGWDGL